MRRGVLVFVLPLLLLVPDSRLEADELLPTAAELSYVISMRDAFEAYERGEIARVREELAGIRRLGLDGVTERFEFRLLDQRASEDWRQVAWTSDMAQKPPDFVCVPERDVWSLWRASDRSRIAELPRWESDDGCAVVMSRNAETVVLDPSVRECGAKGTIWTPGRTPESRPLDDPMLVNAVAVSPDGKQVAMALNERGVSICKDPYWSASTVVGVHSNPRAVAIDDRGWVAVGCEDGSVLIIRFDGSDIPKCAARFFAFDGEVSRVEFRGRELLLAECEDGSSRAWNLVGAETRCGIPGSSAFELKGGVVTFGWIRDGDARLPAFRLGDAVFASEAARELDAAASASFELERSVALARIAIAPDGRTRATACSDGSVELTDVRTGRRLGILNESGPIGSQPRNDEPVAVGCNGNSWHYHFDVAGLAFSPDGSTLVGFSDAEVLRWTLLEPIPVKP